MNNSTKEHPFQNKNTSKRSSKSTCSEYMLNPLQSTTCILTTIATIRTIYVEWDGIFSDLLFLMEDHMEGFFWVNREEDCFWGLLLKESRRLWQLLEAKVGQLDSTLLLISWTLKKQCRKRYNFSTGMGWGEAKGCLIISSWWEIMIFQEYLSTYKTI